jgi:tetratricopeptide (TPR) repeat protein
MSMELGRPARAIKWCRQAIDDARTTGEKEALAHAYKILDWAYMEIGEVESAVYSRIALRLYGELGDVAGQGSVLNDMGAFAYWAGHWTEALDLYKRGQEAWKRAGDAVNTAFTTVNIAEILSDQGFFDEAEAMFKEATRVWQAAGYRGGVAYAKSNLGRVAARAGRFDEALRLLEEAREGSVEVGAIAEAVETEGRIAECHLLNGDANEAIAGIERALTHAKMIGGVAPPLPMLHRIHGWALMQLGKLADADLALNESLKAGRARKADFEIALTLRAMARLAALRHEDVPRELQTESALIMDRLGVVHVSEPQVVDTADV